MTGMSAHFRWTVLLGLCVLAGCGGGGSSPSSATGSSGSSTSSSSSSSSSSSGSSGVSSSSGSNVVTVTVNQGPPAAEGGTFNIPYTSVTVCLPGTTTCAVINDVLVDTGSYGLRIMASALALAGLTQTDLADPNQPGNTLAECVPFADGYTWGPLMGLDISIGGERAPGATVNIINDNGAFAPQAPSACVTAGNNNSLNAVTDFDANGVLGVGAFDQDCGASCAECSVGSGADACNQNNDPYYTCDTATKVCTSAPVALNVQVQNPVALFAVDNNGVILALPSVPPAGQSTASGTLTFGISTEANNALGSQTILALDGYGNFTTTYKSQTLDSSFIDSGSNGLYFPDNSITVCSNTQSDSSASDFYCPPSPLSEMAYNETINGTMSAVPFEIMSLNSFNGTFHAWPTVGGPAPSNTTLGSYFDWGLPFFYGRSVYVAIEGLSAGGTVGPYDAY
jgi:hypothetical protein